MEKSPSIINITKAFIEAQKVMGGAKKSSFNPHLKNKYANLNAVTEAAKEALNQHDIAVLQPIVLIEGFSFVETMLLHISGEYFSGSLTPVINPKANDAQSQGAGISYARKYGLSAMVSLETEDDEDGEGIKDKTVTREKVKPDNKVLDTEEEARLKLINGASKLEDLTALRDGGIPKEGWTQKLLLAAKHKAEQLKAVAPTPPPAEVKKEAAKEALKTSITDGKTTEPIVTKTLPEGVQETYATQVGHGIIEAGQPKPAIVTSTVEDELEGL